MVTVRGRATDRTRGLHRLSSPDKLRMLTVCSPAVRAADELEKLAGLGRKTANVIRAVWFGHATMAVDTHVYRVSHRMGLVPKTADTPRKVEDYLMKHIPAEDIPNAHHWILLHGRYICKSTKPLCDKCFFNEYCPKLLKDSKL